MNFQKKLNNIECEDIVSNLDLNKNDIVYVCSDIREILIDAKKNKIKFNLDDFIDSIIKKIGSGGTILFPTFNWGFCKNKTFDYIKTPSQCGSLSNHALKRKDFKRTKHPIYSFSVWGKDQQKLIDMDNTSSWDESSPFYYLFRKKAKNLFIGLDYKNGFTMDHYFEQKNNVEYRYHKDFRANYIDKEGKIEKKTYSMFVRDIKKVDVTGISSSLDSILIKNDGYKKYIINNIHYGIINLEIAGNIIDNDLKENKVLIYPIKN